MKIPKFRFLASQSNAFILSKIEDFFHSETPFKDAPIFHHFIHTFLLKGLVEQFFIYELFWFYKLKNMCGDFPEINSDIMDCFFCASQAYQFSLFDINFTLHI